MLAINAQGLKVALGGRLVLADVSFQVKLGELAAIVGPNGAGKTTLLKVLLGLLPPVEGRLEFFGRPAGGENRKLLGYLPQNSQFDRNFPMTVADVVQMGQGSWSFFYRPEASVEEETRRCLNRWGWPVGKTPYGGTVRRPPAVGISGQSIERLTAACPAG